jgi:hypothetical protein
VLKEVYNPKAVIPHAALLDQASAHCPIFPTAASRRSLGRVSVPVWPVTLSGRLPVKALVGHYPTNKLIGREHIPHQKTLSTNTPCSSWSHPVLATLSGSYPEVEGRSLTCYSPVRRSSTPKRAFPLDLHVLSTPPAFVLSQDQTLHRKHQQKTITQAKKRKTSKQSPESSFVNSKKPSPQPTKTISHGTRIHTNQFIDKHTVEFSKIRRAPDRPRTRRSRGQPTKTYRSTPVGVKSPSGPSCRPGRPASSGVGAA